MYRKRRLSKTLGPTLRPHKQHEQFISLCHALLRPNTYLEIGVDQGRSLALALDSTRAVGVDPKPCVQYPLGQRVEVTEDQSDNFFESNVATDLFHGSPIDLGFIDGLHLYEQALKDFNNTEKLCHRNSLLILDDCVPPNEAYTHRRACEGVWTGDVWKLLVALAQYRPDLRITLLDLYPAGLAIIDNLDPTSTTIESHESHLISEFMSMRFPGREFLTRYFNTLAFRPGAITEFLIPYSAPLTTAECLTLERRYYRLRWGELRLRTQRKAARMLSSGFGRDMC